jgi:hypothetical protein
MKTKTVLTTLVIGAVCQFAPQTSYSQDMNSFEPVVVKTVPQAGSPDVSPGEFEIKVTFSREMMDQSWSWCDVWKNSTPEGLEKPRYETDHKTCTLKVKLEPNQTYGYWLNTETYRHFQDTLGRPAVPYLLTFSTQGSRSRAADQINRVITTDTIETELGQALSESSPGKREAELNHIQRTMADDEMPAALAFLANKGETGLHSLFGDLASKWASQNPGAAVAWATNLPDAGARKSALINVLKGWTQVAPEAAAACTATVPAGELHDRAVLMVAGEWAFHDAYGAAEWVSHFPKGTLRDKAVGPIIFWGQGQAPAAVAEMLDTIGDTNLIQQNGETIASIWLQRDDAAARAWIKKSPLSDEAKQRLLKSN